MAKDLKRHFSKEDRQVSSKHMKKCSTSLEIREMKTRTTVRYHFTPFRVVITKKIDNNKCFYFSRTWRNWNHTLLVGIKMGQPLWKTLGSSSRVKQLTLTVNSDSAVFLQGIIYNQKDSNQNHTKTCTWVFT